MIVPILKNAVNKTYIGFPKKFEKLSILPPYITTLNFHSISPPYTTYPIFPLYITTLYYHPLLRPPYITTLYYLPYITTLYYHPILPPYITTLYYHPILLTLYYHYITTLYYHPILPPYITTLYYHSILPPYICALYYHSKLLPYITTLWAMLANLLKIIVQHLLASQCGQTLSKILVFLWLQLYTVLEYIRSCCRISMPAKVLNSFFISFANIS